LSSGSLSAFGVVGGHELIETLPAVATATHFHVKNRVEEGIPEVPLRVAMSIEGISDNEPARSQREVRNELAFEQ